MSIRVHAVSRDKARCPFCREDLVGAGIPCPDCGASLHKECWADVRECPTLGCGFGATPASSSSSARARAARPAAPPNPPRPPRPPSSPSSPRPPVARAVPPPAPTEQSQQTSSRARQGLSPPRGQGAPTDEAKRQAHVSGSLAAYLVFCVTAIVASFAVPLPLAMVFGCFTALVSYMSVHKNVLNSHEATRPTAKDQLEAMLSDQESTMDSALESTQDSAPRPE